MPLLAGTQPNELPLLGRIRIYDTIAVRVVENDCQITVNKTADALKFYVDSEIATRIGNLQLLSLCIQWLYSDRGETCSPISLSWPVEQTLSGVGCGVISHSTERSRLPQTHRRH